MTAKDLKFVEVYILDHMRVDEYVLGGETSYITEKGLERVMNELADIFNLQQ
jgi:hypothetical protein